MEEHALFTGFWSKESTTTSKVLARIPEGSDYRPDPKSRIAREIAWQIVVEEQMLVEALERGTVLAPVRPLPETMEEVCAVYERQRQDIISRLHALTPERWNGTLECFGRQRPASPMAWSFLFDIVHHRGQLTTYLRAMGSTVPQIYGPSADEP
ncbi:MAG: DinB family protein [Vicinamibacterales bacterium]